MKDELWYASQLSTGPVGEGIVLTSAYAQGDEVQAAQPFTVSLVSAYISADHIKNKNWFKNVVERNHDILIYSLTTRGARAPVQRVHSHKRDVDLSKDQFISDMLSDTVHICTDYNGTDDLFITLHVTTPSTLRMKSDGTFAQLGQVAGSAGGFPALAPYLPEIKVGLNLLEAAEHLLTAHLDDAAEKVQDSMRLQGANTTETKTLRYGRYVAFSEAVDGTQFKLLVNGRVEGPDVDKLSYAVFRIDQQNAPTPDFVQTQSVATLLTGLNQREEGTGSSPAIDFLKATVQGYSDFQDLQRYQQLKQKPDPTEAEQALLKKLEAKPALQPFLH